MNEATSLLGTSGKMSIPTAAELGFDPQEMKAKYEFERDRRLRSDANTQYRPTDGEFAQYNEDPFTPRTEREPVRETVEVLVMGGGFGGLYTAARLQKAGIENFRIIERAGDFGGTWYWNRYPGAQCDVESYIYLPLLEDTGYMPKEKYSYRGEIFEHAQRIGRHFGLYERSYFQTQLTKCSWNEATDRWTVETDRGDIFDAHYLVMATGSLTLPQLPSLPGLQDFQGHTFHTSRWDYAYTGGSATTPMDRLGDKRVGIIGTGATAVQSIPPLGRDAKHLYVFQRTPSSVAERGNSQTDPEWFKSLQPGWQAVRDDNFTALLLGSKEEDLVNDGWTELFKSLGDLLDGSGASDLSDAELALLGEIADYKHDIRIRDRVSAAVEDPKTAEALKHWYRPWCKRPTFNDEYLPTFNRPNVTLVDTDGKGVERLTAKGVVVAGVEYELDCLVFATGFEVDRANYARQAGIDVTGRGGVKLADYWSKGMRTYHGMLSHNFPNLFHVGFTQTGYTPNFTYMGDNQSRHIAAVIADANAKGIKSMEPTMEAEADYVARVTAPNAMTDYLAACTPGYYNAEGGSANNAGFLQGHWPEGGLKFYEMLAQWRADDKYEGLTLRR